MDEKKRIVDEKSKERESEIEIQNECVDIGRVEENPGVGYEIVIKP